MTTYITNTTRVLYPHLHDHITAPRPAWHANPVRLLAWQLERGKLETVFTVNGYCIRKAWSISRKTEYKISDAQGRWLRTCKQAIEVSAFVYGVADNEEAG